MILSESNNNSQYISLNTPPGTKFRVANEIKVHDNLLYLGPNLLNNLGGEVEEMIREWKVGKVSKKKIIFNISSNGYCV